MYVLPKKIFQLIRTVSLSQIKERYILKALLETLRTLPKSQDVI